MKNLFIVEKNRWMITMDIHGHDPFYYLTKDAGVSWEKVTLTKEDEQEVKDVEKRFGGKALHYSGIYSYTGADKK